MEEKKTAGCDTPPEDLINGSNCSNCPVNVIEEAKEKLKPLTKEQRIWSFIHKFIKNNSEKLRSKYDNDNFFTKLSELLVNKLSNETVLLKNLHRNTIKALPKVIITIFLLYFHEITLITGDYLEKTSGMIGQYKKLRAIADHIGVELPFIMGDVVERILKEKRVDIFSGKFFPSQENISRLDTRLTPSRRMVKTISRWIKQNSNYKNLTELKEIVFEKKFPRSKDDDTRLVLLNKDKDKNRELLRDICDTIIEGNPIINSYNDITREIGTSVTTLMKNDDYRRYLKYPSFLKLQMLYGRPMMTTPIDQIIVLK